MRLTRRRFLLCAAAALAVGQVTRGRWEWRGSALGAEARLVLDGPRDRAEDAAAAAFAEIERLEDIFSLHRPGSELSRLNANGELSAPSRDLRDGLAAAARWRRLTEGAFDVAVQPLWRHWTDARAETEAAALARVRAARIAVTPGRVVLSSGAALTLNGVAQGIVADRVADLLARRGFTPWLIDTGEMRLAGPERQAVELPAAGLRLSLAETALATSEPGALVLDPARGRHHLFDPLTGASPGWWRAVTVAAPTAETADALSTAFAISPPEAVGDIAAGLPGVAVAATGADGRTRLYGAARRLFEQGAA